MRLVPRLSVFALDIISRRLDVITAPLRARPACTRWKKRESR